MENEDVDFGDSFRTTTRPATRLISDIIDTSRELMAQMSRSMGVNATDLAAIQLLMMAGPLTPSEIAQRLDMSPAAVTTVIDRLERVGSVTRNPHPSDRRAILVTVSSAAMEFAVSSVLPMALAIDAVIDEFDADDQAAITRYLTRVLEVHQDLLPD